MKQPSVTLFNFLARLTDRARATRGCGTVANYRHVMTKLRTFLNDRDMPIDGLTPHFMQRYQAWMRDGGLSPNTIAFHFRTLRIFYNAAVNEDITVRRADLFKDVRTAIGHTRKRAVSPVVLHRLAEAHLSCQPKLALARDLFLFSFYTCGMSFVDMAYLRKCDVSGTLLTYRRSKTGQALAVRLTPELTAIIDRWGNPSTAYVLPIITDASDARRQYKNADRRQNRALARLSDHLGLDVALTMYVARHSWASIAYNCGISMAHISSSLGHDSEHTTRIYLTSLEQDGLDKANRLVIDTVTTNGKSNL